MNRPSKTKSLLIPLFTALTGIFAACTNSDYDFNEIDLTLGLGGDELVIPTSNTKEMFIDDFLELEDGDCVQVQDNGDYAFVQEGNDVDPAKPMVKKPNFTFEPDPLEVNLDKYLQDSPNETKNLTRADHDIIEINHKNVVVTFEFDAEQPEILSIQQADITAKLTLTTTFSDALKRNIQEFDKFEWLLPEYLIVDKEKTETKGVTYNEKTNSLSFTNVATTNGISFDIYLSKFDFTKMQDKELKVTDGKLSIKGEILLHIYNAYVTLNKEQKPTDVRITSNLSLSNEGISINKAIGKFDPEIDLSDLGDVEVSNTPDFLDNEDVKIDFANPQIIVNIANNMNVAAILNGTLTATKGNTSKEIKINEIEINPADEGETKICICKNNDESIKTKYAGYTIKEVKNLSDLFVNDAIPDRIKFGAEVKVDNNRGYSTIELGKEYEIKPSYEIFIPIAFGEKAIISYSDTIDNLQDDLDGIELTKDAYLELTANVENKLPMHLNAKVIPLDINGENISKNVSIDIKENMPGTKDEKKAAEGNLKITIKGDIKQLDKLVFTIDGRATEEGQSITGVTLNKNKHSLKLKNVNVKIVGRIIYDAN